MHKMSGLDGIAVRVEGAPATGAGSNNVASVLHEIRHALRQLSRTGETATIDLSAMPFLGADEDDLLAVLGRGEASATVNALGETRIEETAYAGVWLVDHRGPDGDRLALHIEVAEVPLLLKTPGEDIQDALGRLEQALDEGVSSRET
jgi:hydrogenase-1 operon protein HyaF